MKDKAKSDKDAREKKAQSLRERAIASGDADWLEEQAQSITKAADKKFGEWTDEKFKTASEEDWNARKQAAKLMEDARGIREGEDKKSKEKPWVEGVVSARGLSIGDVFNNMRGMNGAAIRDPQLDAAQTTASNTKEMKESLNAIKEALAGEGVK